MRLRSVLNLKALFWKVVFSVPVAGAGVGGGSSVALDCVDGELTDQAIGRHAKNGCSLQMTGRQ